MNADAIIKRLSEQIAQLIVANEVLRQQLIETQQMIKKNETQKEVQKKELQK
jgi:hypothetical protein